MVFNIYLSIIIIMLALADIVMTLPVHGVKMEVFASGEVG